MLFLLLLVAVMADIINTVRSLIGGTGASFSDENEGKSSRNEKIHKINRFVMLVVDVHAA